MRRIMAAAIAVAATAVTAATPPPRPIGIVETSSVRTPDRRLTIVSAFSCPYCRVFDQQAMRELRGVWGARGVQIETVPVVISPTDVATTIAATCGDMAAYARRTTILFRAQSDISSNWNAADADARRRAADRPDGGGAVEIARLSGVDQLGPSLGITPAKLASCLADPRRQKAVYARQKAADARWDIQGTPTVLLDGRKLPSTWAGVRTVLANGNKS